MLESRLDDRGWLAKVYFELTCKLLVIIPTPGHQHRAKLKFGGQVKIKLLV